MAEASGSQASFYTWQAPGKPVVVHLSLKVVEGIAEEAFQGLRALPRRGAEIGGILLGSAERGEQAVVRIVDSVPVPCRHYYGPSYALTLEEKQAFRQVLARWKPGPERSVYAVGYYRSHTRDELFLSDDDVWLMTTYFADPCRVALLVKPRITAPSIGGFFIWEEDRIRAESSYLEFPFDAAALAAVAREPGAAELAPPASAPAVAEAPEPEPAATAPEPQAEPPTPPAPAVEPEAQPAAQPPPAEEAAATAPEPAGAAPTVEPPAAAEEAPPSMPAPPLESRAPELEPFTLPSFLRSVPPPRTRRRWGRIRGRWLCIPIGFALVVLGGFLGTHGARYLNWAPQAVLGPDPYALRLGVTAYGDNLHVTWDRRAPALALAERAILIIADGDQTRTLELDAAQLRSGSVIYRRVGSPVRFRLELLMKGNRTLSEAWESPPAGSGAALP